MLMTYCCNLLGFCQLNPVSIVAGLQLRSIEEPAGGAGAGMPATTCYDAECARTEAWLDENQEFVHDYFLRFVPTLLRVTYVHV